MGAFCAVTWPRVSQRLSGTLMNIHFSCWAVSGDALTHHSGRGSVQPGGRPYSNFLLQPLDQCVDQVAANCRHLDVQGNSDSNWTMPVFSCASSWADEAWPHADAIHQLHRCLHGRHRVGMTPQVMTRSSRRKIEGLTARLLRVGIAVVQRPRQAVSLRRFGATSLKLGRLIVMVCSPGLVLTCRSLYITIT